MAALSKADGVRKGTRDAKRNMLNSRCIAEAALIQISIFVLNKKDFFLSLKYIQKNFTAGFPLNIDFLGLQNFLLA